MKTIEDLEKQYNISVEELQNFYSTHSNIEVSERLGVSKSQTLRILKAFNITPKVAYKTHIKINDLINSINIDQFKKDYYIYTQAELAAKYNLSIKQIVELRQKLNLNFRKVWKKTDEYSIDKIELGNYYKSHTLVETTNYFNIGSIATLKVILQKYNIPIEKRITGYATELSTKISKEELSQYYTTHTLKETQDYFRTKLVGQLIKYYGLAKSKSHEKFESILSRINQSQFCSDFNNLNTYELFEKYNLTYTSYRKLIHQYNLGYKPGVFAYQNASASKYEDNFYLYLRQLLSDSIKIIRHDRTLLEGKEIDIYIPDFNIGIEFNGDYWHSDLKCTKNTHYNKALLAQAKGIYLIFVWEYEWLNPISRLKLENLFKILFNKVDKKIFARNCEIKQISNIEAKPFNNTTHLQGHRNAQVTYGLFYKNELVQLMSFSKTRYNKNLKNDNDWEIIRGCPGSNNIVVGGVSKLFAHFIDDYSPNKVFSYCDFNKFNGKSYEILGMKFIGYTGPDLKYKLQDGTVVNRNPKNYKYNNEHCAYRMFGAGSKKYVWGNL